MKFLLTFIVVVLVSATATLAADCTVAGRSLNRGQKYSPPGECLQYTCSGKNAVSALNCAYAPTPRGCRTIPENRNKPYPQCCPRVVC